MQHFCTSDSQNVLQFLLQSKYMSATWVKKLKNLWPRMHCRSCSHGGAPSSSRPVWCWLITVLWHVSGFRPEEMCEACSVSALLQELLWTGEIGGWGESRRRVEASGQLHGRTWDSECSLMQSRQYLRSDGCRVQEPDIFSRQVISRRDEISKWSTCLRMHGIPQGWTRATGYKSNTPAPGVKTGRECDT